MKKIIILVLTLIFTVSIALLANQEINEVSFISIFIILLFVGIVTFVETDRNLFDIFNETNIDKKTIPDIKLVTNKNIVDSNSKQNLLFETAKISYIIAKQNYGNGSKKPIFPIIHQAQRIMEINHIATKSQIRYAVLKAVELYFPKDFSDFKKEVSVKNT